MDKFRTGMPLPEMVRELNRLDSRQAGGLTATSFTELAVGEGERVLEVGPDLQFVPGQPVRIASAGDPAGTYMDGIVTSYEGSTLAVYVDSSQGSGTGSAWVVTVTGAQGPQGGLTEADLDARLTPVAAAVSFLPVAATKRGQVALWLEDGLLGAADLTPALRAKATRDVARPVRLLSAQRIPLAVTAGNLVPLWLENGMLAALGMTSQLRYDATRDVMTRVEPSAVRIPLMHDSRGAVPIWWEDGLGTARLSEGFKRLVRQAFGEEAVFAPAVAPLSDRVPVSTDGRSLFRLRAKLADAAASTPMLLQIGFTGDSWAEYLPIIQEMRALLGRKGYAPAGDGWQSVSTSNKMPGITFTRSAGWTFLDGSSTGTVFPYGAGPDGMNLHTDRNDQTASLAGIRATRLWIFFWQTTGTFRWRVDGGAWTPVTGDDSNTLGIVRITGLADATHTLEIDTQGNTGRVSLTGFNARYADTGFVVHKMGNAGARGQHFLSWSHFIAPHAAELQLDAVPIILGTNDKTNAGSPPSVFVQAADQIGASYRAGVPAVGLIHIIPADSQGGVVTPLAEYRDALYQYCVSTSGREFYNMHDQFGPYPEASALGQWLDNNHLNNRGAANLGRELDRRFFNL